MASVPPESMYGTARAPGSSATRAADMAATSGPSNEVSSGGCRWTTSISRSGPITSRNCSIKDSCWPGSVRQSMVALARLGITFSL